MKADRRRGHWAELEERELYVPNRNCTRSFTLWFSVWGVSCERNVEKSVSSTQNRVPASQWWTSPPTAHLGTWSIGSNFLLWHCKQPDYDLMNGTFLIKMQTYTNQNKHLWVVTEKLNRNNHEMKESLMSSCSRLTAACLVCSRLWRSWDKCQQLQDWGPGSQLESSGLLPLGWSQSLVHSEGDRQAEWSSNSSKEEGSEPGSKALNLPLDLPSNLHLCSDLGNDQKNEITNTSSQNELR